VKGTRLWSQPRSPLIQGRSRRERPFWADWGAAAVLGALAGAVAGATLLAPDGADWVAALQAAAIPLVLGAAVGGAIGVQLAAAFGWYPRWIGAAAIAAVASVAAVWLAAGL